MHIPFQRRNVSDNCGVSFPLYSEYEFQSVRRDATALHDQKEGHFLIIPVGVKVKILGILHFLNSTGTHAVCSELSLRLFVTDTLLKRNTQSEPFSLLLPFSCLLKQLFYQLRPFGRMLEKAEYIL